MISKACIPHNLDIFQDDMEQRALEFDDQKPILITPHGVLFNSDCVALFDRINDDSIDCIFADPPFNLAKDYGNGKHTDLLPDNMYLNWSRAWLSQAIRILKPGGALFVYILPRWGYHLAHYLEEMGMLFRHWIAVSMKSTFPRGRRLYPAHYSILYFSKGEPRTFHRIRLPIPTCRHCGKELKDYGGHRKKLNPEGLNLTDFWEDTSPVRHKKFKSRSGMNELKPIIPRRCIEISTIPGDVIVDPFGGGGSTYQVAEELKRYWIGSEIADCRPIIERLRKHSLEQNSEIVPQELARVFRTERSLTSGLSVSV